MLAAALGPAALSAAADGCRPAVRLVEQSPLTGGAALRDALDGANHGLHRVDHGLAELVAAGADGGELAQVGVRVDLEGCKGGGGSTASSSVASFRQQLRDGVVTVQNLRPLPTLLSMTRHASSLLSRPSTMLTEAEARPLALCRSEQRAGRGGGGVERAIWRAVRAADAGVSARQRTRRARRAPRGPRRAAQPLAALHPPLPRRCAPAATRISASPGRVSRRARRHDAA